MKLNALPKRIGMSFRRSPDRDELKLRGREFEVFRVTTFRLTYLCFS